MQPVDSGDGNDVGESTAASSTVFDSSMEDIPLGILLLGFQGIDKLNACCNLLKYYDHEMQW